MRCLQLIEAAHATTLPARARRASRSCSSPKPRRSPARPEDEVACSASVARRRENARTHRELLALLGDTMKLDEDPSEQEEQLGRKRSSRKNKEQRGAARAATIAFDSEEWDEIAPISSD